MDKKLDINRFSISDTLLALINDDKILSEDLRKISDMEKEIILKQYDLPTETSKDGYYHKMIKTDDGKRKHLKAKTVEELKEKIYQYEKGAYAKPENTFKAVFSMVEDKKLEIVKSEEKRKSVSNTISKERSDYKRFFNGTDFEKKLVSDITIDDVEKVCLDNLKKSDIRPKAYKSMQSILRAVFRFAFQKHWIYENIFERCDFKQYDSLCIKPTSIRKRSHSDKDIERMVSYIHEHQDRYPKYIPSFALELQLCLGLRRGEVPPLQWDNIITSNDIIYLEISREMLRDSTIVNHTKTYKDRLIPLTPEALDIIKRLEQSHKIRNAKSEYLFPADTSNGCITYDTVTDFYYRMIRKLGIPTDRDCMKGTQAYRRTVATNLRNKGINPQTVANILGHSIQVQENNYYTGGYDSNELKMLNAASPLRSVTNSPDLPIGTSFFLK